MASTTPTFDESNTKGNLVYACKKLVELEAEIKSIKGDMLHLISLLAKFLGDKSITDEELAATAPVVNSATKATTTTTTTTVSCRTGKDLVVRKFKDNDEEFIQQYVTDEIKAKISEKMASNTKTLDSDGQAKLKAEVVWDHVKNDKKIKEELDALRKKFNDEQAQKSAPPTLNSE